MLVCVGQVINAKVSLCDVSYFSVNKKYIVSMSVIEESASES